MIALNVWATKTAIFLWTVHGCPAGRHMVRKVIRDQKKSQRPTKPAISAQCSKGQQRAAKVLLSHCWYLLNSCELTWTGYPLGRCCKLPHGGGACFERGLSPWCPVLHCMLKVQIVPKDIMKQMERYRKKWKIFWDTFQLYPGIIRSFHEQIWAESFKYALSFFPSPEGSRTLGGAYGSPAGLSCSGVDRSQCNKWRCNRQSHVSGFVMLTYIIHHHSFIIDFQIIPFHLEKIQDGFHQVSFFWKPVVKVRPVRLHAAWKVVERRQTGQEMPKSLAYTWTQAWCWASTGSHKHTHGESTIRTIEMNSDELMWSLTTWPTRPYRHTWPSNVWRGVCKSSNVGCSRGSPRPDAAFLFLGRMEPARLINCWYVFWCSSLLAGLLDSFKDKSAWTYFCMIFMMY